MKLMTFCFAFIKIFSLLSFHPFSAEDSERITSSLIFLPKNILLLDSPVIYELDTGSVRGVQQYEYSACVQPSFRRILLKHSLQSRLIIQLLTPFLSQKNTMPRVLVFNSIRF